jgi:dihydrofolate reductase
MRKVILSMMVSVDGYIEAKDPNYYWHTWNEEMAAYMMGFFQTVDTFIYGRKAYEEMITYWPPLDDEFAKVMNHTPKLVFSRTLETVTWNATLVRENAAAAIRQEKAKAGKDLALFAGADLAGFFINHDLIDQYRLIVNPVLLGEGKTLFKERAKMKNVRMRETVPFKCGNVLLVYEPEH